MFIIYRSYSIQKVPVIFEVSNNFKPRIAILRNWYKVSCQKLMLLILARQYQKSHSYIFETGSLTNEIFHQFQSTVWLEPDALIHECLLIPLASSIGVIYFLIYPEIVQNVLHSHHFLVSSCIFCSKFINNIYIFTSSLLLPRFRFFFCFIFKIIFNQNSQRLSCQCPC